MKIRKIKAGEMLVEIADGEEVFIYDEACIASQSDALKIQVGRGCRIKYLMFFDPSSEEPYSGRRELIIGDNSEFDSLHAYFGSGDCTFGLTTKIGEKATFRQRAFFFARNTQSFKLTDNSAFLRPGSYGRLRADGLVADTARAEYFSELTIMKHAQETDTRIDLKLHLLGRQARGTMLPALKISANRVKAGHGASTFQLSDEDLFYLRSRGLSESQARSLAVRSAGESFVKAIEEGEFSALVRDAINKRL